MDIRWTKDISDPGKKEEFRKLLMNSQFVLGKLLDILDDEEAQGLKQETTLADFDAPNWANRQAFRNGQRSSYRKVKDLLNFVRK